MTDKYEWTTVGPVTIKMSNGFAMEVQRIAFHRVASMPAVVDEAEEEWE